MIVLLLLAAFTLLPLISMFLTAIQPEGAPLTGLSIPAHPHWINFVRAWNGANMAVLFRSSVLIVVGVVPISIIFSTLAGYALARIPFPGHKVVGLIFVLGLTLPFESMIAPLYYEVQSLGILNTQAAVIAPLIGLFMPFSVYWMRGHFANMPNELSEAAQVDGASTFRTFRSVYLPLAAPAWSSLSILLFLWTWNQFLIPLVLVADPSKRTLAGALGAFQGIYGSDEVLLCAGALIIIAPTLLIFVVFQRQFIRALLDGANK